MIRRLLWTAVVLAVLAAGANIVAGRYAEGKAADAIQTSLKLPARPEVKMDAFPILWRLWQRRIPRVTVDAVGVSVGGLEVARFHLVVDDLRVSFGDLASLGSRLSVGGGTAFGEVTQDAVNAYLERQRQGVRVVFSGSDVRVRAKAVYLGRTHDLEAQGTLAIEGQNLVFRSQAVTVDGGAPPPAFAEQARRDTSFRVPMPALPGGVRPKRVAVQDARARLDVEFGATTLDLSKL